MCLLYQPISKQTFEEELKKVPTLGKGRGWGDWISLSGSFQGFV